MITIASLFLPASRTPKHSGNRTQQQEVKQPGKEETFKARPWESALFSQDSCKFSCSKRPSKHLLPDCNASGGKQLAMENEQEDLPRGVPGRELRGELITWREAPSHCS